MIRLTALEVRGECRNQLSSTHMHTHTHTDTYTELLSECGTPKTVQGDDIRKWGLWEIFRL